MNLRIFSFVTLVLTFILINLGGFVHNTNSSLACPDWPLCYGQVMPPMEGGILIEHSHRLLASLVGLLSTLLVYFSYRQKNFLLIKLASLSLVMVIIQGLLGGLTVIYKLPTLVSTAHLGLSLMFLCSLVYFNHQCSSSQSSGEDQYSGFRKITLGLLYLQMLLGAFVRHSGLGGVCGVGRENSFSCFEPDKQVHSWIPESTTHLLHMTHRFGAVVVGIIITGLASMVVWKSIKQRHLDKFILAALSLILVALQIQLGIWSVAGGLRAYTTTMHLGVGTLLLISLWKLHLCSVRQNLP